jgi:(1->4)-alpha-D-glucan 1-alpha-D-glucosylmutase
MSATPRATYRLQFHKDFTFDDAAAIVPDLAELGVSHVYASPILASRPGSTHGYDGTDPRVIDPELGGDDAFLRLTRTLRQHGLGLIVDFVPNHLAAGTDNPWWVSVLAEGPASPHADVFDIDWERGGGKVLLPVLGAPYGDVLEAGELVPRVEAETGRFVIDYHGTAFPLRGDSLPDDLALALSRGDMSPAEVAGRLAGRPGEPASFDALHEVLEAQHWRLAWWRTAWSDINYRRFFEIDALVGLRVEDPQVFEAVHGRILALVRDGHVQGLRIDHIDGLADPEAYLRQLRAQVGPGVVIVVEKILAGAETLRPWPIEGTTGYEVLNWIDGLLVGRDNRRAIERVYAEASGDRRPMEAHVEDAKRWMLGRAFAGERSAIVGDLATLAAASRHTRDFRRAALDEALVDIVVAFPVYRSYRTAGPLVPADATLIAEVLEDAKRLTSAPTTLAHGFIAEVMASRLDGDDAATVLRARIVRRIQQLTGPVMAKSLEDTAFYRHVPLLALNEVGGEPNEFGLEPGEFHARVSQRAKAWPAAWIATTTHDTKRSEDNRSRLLALSHDPGRWRDAVQDFMGVTEPAGDDPERGAPDGVDRIMILQAILGAWPVGLLDDGAGDDAAWSDFEARIQAFAEKAIREAKRHTAWTHQNPTYEAAVRGFIGGLFSGRRRALAALRPLASELTAAGAGLSIVRTVLKLTLPGVPDFYQGSELWDYAMVDPDNRRPVDYARRTRMLRDGRSLAKLAADWRDGGIKLAIIRTMLRDRQAEPDFYAGADYDPWDDPDDRIVGFIRRTPERVMLVVVDRGKPLPLGPSERAAALASDPCMIRLPDGRGPQARWTDLLSGRSFPADAEMPRAELFRDLPALVLIGS